MRRMAATAYASVEGSEGILVTPTFLKLKLSKTPDDCKSQPAMRGASGAGFNLNQSQRPLGLDGSLFDSSTLLII